MKHYRYNDILGFKAGERYCESCQYGNIWFTVKTDAVETDDGQHKQVRFVGVTDDGREIEYLITKGFEHYGPQIYDEPAYLSLADIRKILNTKE